MIPKEIEEAYNEYLDKYRIYKEKYISWLRGNIGMIFKMKSQEPFHVNNPFGGGGSTTVFNGYCKIVEDSDGKIIVRIMHMDGITSNDHPGIRFCVSVKNFTGYTYESLMEILDFPVDREDLIPFVQDVMDGEYETGRYFMEMESIKDNRKPWEREKGL